MTVCIDETLQLLYFWSSYPYHFRIDCRRCRNKCLLYTYSWHSLVVNHRETKHSMEMIGNVNTNSNNRDEKNDIEIWNFLSVTSIDFQQWRRNHSITSLGIIKWYRVLGKPNKTLQDMEQGIFNSLSNDKKRIRSSEIERLKSCVDANAYRFEYLLRSKARCFVRLANELTLVVNHWNPLNTRYSIRDEEVSCVI